jgi:hypothetical protein
MTTGIELEIAERYVEAAEWYRDQIENHYETASADTFINLSFLYWNFGWLAPPEFVWPHNIPEEWQIEAAEKLDEIIQLGIQKFPDNVEFYFWHRYYMLFSIGEDFTHEECLAIVNKYGLGDNLAPAFFLHYEVEKYRKDAEELYRRCIAMPSTKNSYIAAVLRGHWGSEEWAKLPIGKPFVRTNALQTFLGFRAKALTWCKSFFLNPKRYI